jgi:hypothetical protein
MLSNFSELIPEWADGARDAKYWNLPLPDGLDFLLPYQGNEEDFYPLIIQGGAMAGEQPEMARIEQITSDQLGEEVEGI